MTIKELLSEISQLALEERISLLETLVRSLRTELRPTPTPATLSSRVRGLLKSAGPIPTDAQLNDLRTQHLLEKYA